MKDDDERLPVPDENPDAEVKVYVDADIKVFVQGIASTGDANS